MNSKYKNCGKEKKDWHCSQIANLWSVYCIVFVHVCTHVHIIMYFAMAIESLILLIDSHRLPSDTFSPASGGSVNVSSAMDDIRIHGTIRLTP